MILLEHATVQAVYHEGVFTGFAVSHPYAEKLTPKEIRLLELIVVHGFLNTVENSLKEKEKKMVY